MELLVLVGVVVAAVVGALAAARGLLGAIFYLMAHPPTPVTIHWRPVVFIGALFWFWYLTPVVAEHQVIARVLHLLAP